MGLLRAVRQEDQEKEEAKREEESRDDTDEDEYADIEGLDDEDDEQEGMCAVSMYCDLAFGPIDPNPNKMILNF